MLPGRLEALNERLVHANHKTHVYIYLWFSEDEQTCGYHFSLPVCILLTTADAK